MKSNEAYRVAMGSRIAARPRWPLVVFAVGFLVLYLGSDFFIPNLASGPMPLPNAPAGETQTWFADNTSAAVLLGVCQLLSVLCLGGFAVELRRTASTPAQVVAARRATPWALIAVCAMALSSLLAWILTASAPGASLGTVTALRTSSFIAGGTAHVVALGIFVLLAARIPGFGKAIRVFAVVAATPALVSLVSLVWFQGAVFILLGRLLCMVWILCAAISAMRRMARGVWS